jgi:LytS/YehU family sensor histidine kinase
LLIPFVENAFKHGSIIEGYLNIEIKMTFLGDQFGFSIRNTVNSDNINGTAGIGLKNIRKRLDINYKGNYELNIENKDNWFVVNLSIFNLKSNKDA